MPAQLGIQIALKNSKSKLQTIQNKCNRYCFQMDNRNYTGMKDFEKINWLLVSKKFNKYLCSNACIFSWST